jgi:hypothetical protein
MKQKIEEFLRPIALSLVSFGFDPRKLFALRFYFRFRRQRSEWLRQGGKISKNYRILTDFTLSAGTASGHYFHQDLLVAGFIHKANPTRHIDIGSRIDGFVAHVAAFRKIEVMDIRDLVIRQHANISFLKQDLMQIKGKFEKTDSLSCLHAIEHFGLGRYNDPIDVDGHNKGISNLVDLVALGGLMYISFPIGENDEVHFNAHRVFHPASILDHPCIKQKMHLKRFDYVDDKGDLNLSMNISDVNAEIQYGCGIYTFEKVKED